MVPKIKVTRDIGNTIEIPNEIEVKAKTYLSDDSDSGDSSLSVDNTSDFTDDEDINLLVSSIGNENAEVVKSTANTHTGFTIASLVNDHNRGESVRQVKWDQIVVYRATSSTGVYVAIETRNISVTQQKTVVYDSTGAETSYYKIAWRDSLTGEISDYSEATSVDSYSEKSVYSLIKPVLLSMGVSEDDSKITMPFCISAIDDARKFTEAKMAGIRHSWQQEFEYPIKLLAGTNYVNLPTNIDYSETDRSVLSARFSDESVYGPLTLTYVDKRDWNSVTPSPTGSETSAIVSIGDTEITLDNVGDFPDSSSGVAYVATTDYDEEILEIAYTSIDLTTNQLTGVTGVTREIPSGTRVWSKPTMTQPTFYTVFGDKLYFDRVIPDSMQGKNLYIDYYKKIDKVVSLNQVLPEHYREIYKWYLKYAIKYRKDTSLSSSDPDLKKFEELVEAEFESLYTGQNSTIITN